MHTFREEKPEKFLEKPNLIINGKQYFYRS